MLAVSVGLVSGCREASQNWVDALGNIVSRQLTMATAFVLVPCQWRDSPARSYKGLFINNFDI